MILNKDGRINWAEAIRDITFFICFLTALILFLRQDNMERCPKCNGKGVIFDTNLRKKVCIQPKCGWQEDTLDWKKSKKKKINK